MGDVGVAVYGDLTVGRLARVMRRSVEKSVGSELQRSGGKALPISRGRYWCDGRQSTSVQGP